MNSCSGVVVQSGSGRVVQWHTCAVLKKLAVSVEEFCGVDFGGGVFGLACNGGGGNIFPF